jgi:hypothetical protein
MHDRIRNAPISGCFSQARTMKPQTSSIE